MKKYIVCALLTFLSVQTGNCMARRMFAHFKPLHIQRITPIFFNRMRTPQWPDYTGEQAQLIREKTHKNNHLSATDAYNQRTLGRKIELAAAMVCPEHRPSKCPTCLSPRQRAFSLVSEDISYKQSLGR